MKKVAQMAGVATVGGSDADVNTLMQINALLTQHSLSGSIEVPASFRSANLQDEFTKFDAMVKRIKSSIDNYHNITLEGMRGRIGDKIAFFGTQGKTPADSPSIMPTTTAPMAAFPTSALNVPNPQASSQGTIKMSSIFNLKKAQFDNTQNTAVLPEQTAELPPVDTNLDDSIPGVTELPSDNSQLDNSLKNAGDLQQWLDQTEYDKAKDTLLQYVQGDNQNDVKEMVKRYYEGSDNNEKMAIALEMWKYLPDIVKVDSPEVEEDVIPATFEKYEHVANLVKDVDTQIQKLAQTFAQKDKSQAFNLRKTAQAQTTENVIMYMPNDPGTPRQQRIDPFLRQPISDWHIVERNKGFGLVLDDTWNIDWESIWRGTIMDKYSRPYRDTKTGEWVGGYIQKRFEVDKWIPEENNYQLLPGQLRKPRLPEYGIIEGRLEAMREKEADKRGYAPDSSGKPFDWNTAKNSPKLEKLAKNLNIDLKGMDEYNAASFLMQLHDKGLLSAETLLDEFGFDYASEKGKTLKKEASFNLKKKKIASDFGTGLAPITEPRRSPGTAYFQGKKPSITGAYKCLECKSDWKVDKTTGQPFPVCAVCGADSKARIPATKTNAPDQQGKQPQSDAFIQPNVPITAATKKRKPRLDPKVYRSEKSFEMMTDGSDQGFKYLLSDPDADNNLDKETLEDMKGTAETLGIDG